MLVNASQRVYPMTKKKWVSFVFVCKNLHIRKHCTNKCECIDFTWKLFWNVWANGMKIAWKCIQMALICGKDKSSPWLCTHSLSLRHLAYCVRVVPHSLANCLVLIFHKLIFSCTFIYILSCVARPILYMIFLSCLRFVWLQWIKYETWNTVSLTEI